MVNLEPNVIDDAMKLDGLEDVASNFALGHYMLGKEMVDKVNDRLCEMVDNNDRLQISW